MLPTNSHRLTDFACKHSSFAHQYNHSRASALRYPTIQISSKELQLCRTDETAFIIFKHPHIRSYRLSLDMSLHIVISMSSKRKDKRPLWKQQGQVLTQLPGV